MANFRDLMGGVDARIDHSRISDDLLLPDDVSIRGRFIRETVEAPVETGVGGVSFTGAGMLITATYFRCAATVEVLALVEGDLVEHNGVVWRFVRRHPTLGGDHAGRVTLELGVPE